MRVVQRAIIVIFSVLMHWTGMVTAQHTTQLIVEQLRNSLSVILVDGEVEGYFNYYPYQKTTKSSVEFKVQVFNNLLQPTNEFIVNLINAQDLITVVSNGSTFAFVYHNPAENGYHLMLTDFKGDVIIRRLIGSGVSMDVTRLMVDGIFPVSTEGYIYKIPVDNKFVEFDLISNDGINKWTLTPPAVTKGNKVISSYQELLYSDNRFIVIGDKNRENICLIHSQSGDIEATLSLMHEKGDLTINHVRKVDSGLWVLGSYVAPGGRSWKAGIKRPLGLFRMKYSPEQEDFEEYFFEFQADLAQHIDRQDLLGEKAFRYLHPHSLLPAAGQKSWALLEVFDPGVIEPGSKLAGLNLREYYMVGLTANWEFDTVFHWRMENATGSRSGYLVRSFCDNQFVNRSNRRMDCYFAVSESASSSFNNILYTQYIDSNQIRQPMFEAVGVNKYGQVVRSVIPVGGYPNQVILIPAKVGYVLYYEVYAKAYTVYYNLSFRKFDF